MEQISISQYFLINILYSFSHFCAWMSFDHIKDVLIFHSSLWSISFQEKHSMHENVLLIKKKFFRKEYLGSFLLKIGGNITADSRGNLRGRCKLLYILKSAISLPIHFLITGMSGRGTLNINYGKVRMNTYILWRLNNLSTFFFFNLYVI